MYIIKKFPSSGGGYSPIQTWNENTVPNGFLIWPDDLDTADFYAHNGFVTLELDGNTVVSYQLNAEAWETFCEKTLPDIKAKRIADSKQMLADYLLNHPIQWTDGKYYSITAEKQQQLTSKILSATMASTLSTPYNLTWNSTGDECTTWTLQNLSTLAFAIDARVTSLVSYQQAKEVEIRNAQTVDALQAIVVDYDSVPLPTVSGETEQATVTEQPAQTTAKARTTSTRKKSTT